eukprot:5918825-Ditylum_brightwellii.AAC.1
MGNDMSALSSLFHDNQHDHLISMFAMRWRKKNKIFTTLPADNIKARLTHKLRKIVACLPALSPWQKLYFCGHDPTLITTTGFDPEGFE